VIESANAVVVVHVPASEAAAGDPDGDALVVGYQVDDAGMGRAPRPETDLGATAAQLVEHPADRRAVPLCTILLGISWERVAKTAFPLPA
jgi:hypothetical protein